MSKLGKDTGSIVNWMLSNPNYIEPKVGMDVTELMWTDRHAYHIIEVDNDKKGFTMVKYQPKYIGKEYGDESYEYEDENGNLLLDINNKTHVRFVYKDWHLKFSNHKYGKINLAMNYRSEYRDPSF